MSNAGRSDLDKLLMSELLRMSSQSSEGFMFFAGFWLGTYWSGVLGTILILTGVFIYIAPFRSSIFNRNIAPSCAYCKHGANLGFNEIACSKLGIMSDEGKCNAFRYEPTKRKPEYAKNITLKEYSTEDMQI